MWHLSSSQLKHQFRRTRWYADVQSLVRWPLWPASLEAAPCGIYCRLNRSINSPAVALTQTYGAQFDGLSGLPH
jgi:hypothetical protein